ncbi:DUF192 domain-containing protein [Candidatus Pacearchaeota archaeon]|nr:DUF192 domain-containing protein [Candidatus Pacearchaeota archaeon]
MNNQRNFLGKHFLTILFFVVLIIITIILYDFSLKNDKEFIMENQKVCIDNNCFDVEVADSDYERIKGLMDREFLDEEDGMLFIFPEEDIWSFWMKNTLIPLDIIWINKNMEIVEINKNMLPCEANPCKIYSPENKSKYVLEINSGLVNSLNITKNSKFNFYPNQ